MRNLVEVVGIQRFTKLLVLLLINGLLGASIYYYIIPQSEAAQREFTAVKNDVVRLRGDIDTIEERLVQLKENEKQYDRLLKREFISDQDRINIRKVIDDMRARSGVKTLTYNIAPIEYVEHDHSYALNYDLLKSSVSITTTSLLDLEVLALQAMVNEEFPGHTILENVTYDRTSPITQENLVRLGNGDAIDFMSGKIDFSWYSLSPKKSAEEREAF